MTQRKLTKKDIIRQASILGAEYVGFAAADEWEKSQDIETELFPKNIWPVAKTVIVLAVPLELPGNQVPDSIVLAQTQNRVTNELLDEVAYRLAAFINNNGYPSVNIPQDSSGQNLTDQPTVEVFSHNWAGHYAGLGKINAQDILLGKDGQRLNAVSVLTALAWEDLP